MPALAGLLLCALPALAATPAGCDLHWQLALPADRSQPIAVTLTFDAGNRSRTELQLPDGGDVGVLAEPGAPALDPVPGRPLARSVAHKPGERITLRFMVAPMPGAWLRLGTDSLMLAARALLPWPTEPGRWQMCLGLDGLPGGAALLSNQGQQLQGDEPLLRLQGPASLAREWVLAAGALLLAERQVEGQTLRVVVAADMPAQGFDPDALTDAAARQLALLRRQWGDGPAPAQWLLLLPAPASAAADTLPRGLALHQAVLLQAPAAATPASGALDGVLLETLQQAWLRERFGPVAFEPRADEAPTAWFSRGFASFFAQRLRSASGQWRLQDQAAALNALLPGGSAAGQPAPWLAMRWHTALRAQGQPGLDPLMKRLMLPAGQSQVTGPLSAPLATHRLQAALRNVLAEAPSTDLQQLAGRGPAVALTPEVLGPCFGFDAAARQVVARGEGEPDADCRGWLEALSPPAGVAARSGGSKAAAAKSAKAARSAKTGKTAKAAKSGGKSTKKTATTHKARH
ncbi:hypothetical protein [Aquabacterium sp.]|uniref:hypothetical protein n=1 Tax=Aquabacterium sp. TaxID=1872578 RepID=UPI003783FF00